MFDMCYKLKEIKGINEFKTISAVNFNAMFRDC